MGATWRWAAVTAVAPVSRGTTCWVTGHALPADEPLWGGVLRALPAGLVLLALSQRPRTAALAAALVGLLGVVLLVGAATSGRDPLGVLAAVAGVVASSAATVLSQRWVRRAASGALPPTPRPITMTAWQLTLSGLLLAPAAGLAEGPPPALDGAGRLALACVSLVATALAFAAWSAGLARLDASAVSVIGLLDPVAGVALGTAPAGEQLAPLQRAGLLLVLGGVVLGQVRSPGRRPVVHEGVRRVVTCERAT